ncbi:NADH-dependent flavin oxidoreductase [Burkholderia pseudomultivorans]|uniref:NADH-dependent flavin oxidoreductase n=1 Tax=Burkholderia pseudomultivorans TaxID=1207504 RepID=UPI00075A9FB9|nr:NADH-dependent flavin oxidoreductase [Burkholderia pseudomultivorans]KVC23400.1 NADH:flavin oxidoreductase [Burkholderia pseudomultivorans]KVC36769.1 NADH:flavin oxidoreductase [Burkholderia pseudomultivorans]KVC47791.1 NADH:flavin oxidoreductase [Burkholderia pseudomultivorans]MDS0791435.1 NADH-dependent flavin oxidoreductase [Burkholderia pseudomultivorans]
MTQAFDTLFQPVTFPNGVTFRNRVLMAPMTTWSSDPDGMVSEQELAYYRRRANGVGAVLTGCTHVTESGIGFIDEFAAHDDRHVPSLRKLAQAAKSGGAPAILQIFHAGNKAVPALVPDGVLVSASAMKAPPGPFNSGEYESRALTHDEIGELIHAFGETTRRAIEAGFDGVELHGAHGFLIQNFLSPRFNRRTDAWGGTLENRMRFPLALVAELRRVVARHADRPFLVGYRISPEEPDEGGLRIDDALTLVDRLIVAGIDYIHVSLTDLLNAKPLDADDGRLAIERVVGVVQGRVPVAAAGRIRTPAHAEAALALGVTVVAVGQGLVMNPGWVEHARRGDTTAISTQLNPADVPRLAIPDKLWGVIDATNGWFAVLRDERPAA